jgi:hypothetical protein
VQADLVQQRGEQREEEELRVSRCMGARDVAACPRLARTLLPSSRVTGVLRPSVSDAQLNLLAAMSRGRATAARGVVRAGWPGGPLRAQRVDG